MSMSMSTRIRPDSPEARSIRTWRRAVGLGTVLLGLGGGAAQAQVVTEFSAGITAGGGPVTITSGPDGNLWFTEIAGNRIGRITPLGVVTEFSTGITAGAAPRGITAGPDGNLWFTENNGNRIGRITPLGVVTEFTGITGVAAPTGITAGPDGNLWFTEAAGNRIGRITPLGVITEFSTGITAGAQTNDIAAGPDGNLWFTELAGNRIGRITPLGVVTEFSTGITAGAQPAAITAGPDGNLWFTELGIDRIGRITPLGVVTEFGAGITAGAFLFGIRAGPDGNLWFAEDAGNRIGRITTGSTAPGSGYFPLTPCRVLDTRNPTGQLGGPPLQPAGSADRAFFVTGICGIPPGAVALSVNATVTLTGGSGTLTLYRGDGARTGTWSISFAAGQTRANNDLLQLALDQSGSFRVQNSAPGNVDFVLDVSGYFK